MIPFPRSHQPAGRFAEDRGWAQEREKSFCPRSSISCILVRWGSLLLKCFTASNFHYFAIMASVTWLFSELLEVNLFYLQYATCAVTRLTYVRWKLEEGSLSTNCPATHPCIIHLVAPRLYSFVWSSRGGADIVFVPSAAGISYIIPASLGHFPGYPGKNQRPCPAAIRFWLVSALTTNLTFFAAVLGLDHVDIVRAIVRFAPLLDLVFRVCGMLCD